MTNSSKHANYQDWSRMGLSPVPGVNAFTQACTPAHSKAVSDSLRRARQRTYDAKRRMKEKALRTNPKNDFLAADPKGFKAQQAAIRQEIAKTKAASGEN